MRIDSGSRGIDGIFTGLDDAAVMDDFIFAEPLTFRLVCAGPVAIFFANRRQFAKRRQ